MGKCAFPWLREVLFLLTLAGLGLSTYLVYLHYGAAESGLAKKLCSGTFDCASVLQSRWGYARLGPVQIPIALFGAGYFMVLAVWLAIVDRLPGKLHYACIFPAVLATLGAVDSAYLIYVMGVKLHAWCGFCLAVHGVNFLIFAGFWTQWLAGRRNSSQEESAAMLTRQIWKVPVLAMVTALLLGVTLLALFGAGGMFMLYQKSQWEIFAVQQDEQYQRWKFSQAVPVPLATDADDPSLGPADASHTVVMFGDFQCGYCAQTERTIREVQKQLGGPFRLVFKHYPLNRDCNASIEKGTAPHAFGCMAAEAAEAARRVGGNEAFWKMHDALYENQRRLDEKPYTQIARQIGLDLAAFQRLLIDPATRQRIEQDAALGKQLDVKGTPALFLDGRRVSLESISNPETQKVDMEATVRHWKYLLAATEAAADSQPARTAAPVVSTD